MNIFENMSSGTSNTAYVRKLVKIVYEKERQIQELKRELKEKDTRVPPPSLRPLIQQEMAATAGQLREVSQQMLGMETKMLNLESLLEEEIDKNQELSETINHLRLYQKHAQEQQQTQKHQIQQLQAELTASQQRVKYFQGFESSLCLQVERLQSSLKQIEEQRKKDYDNKSTCQDESTKKEKELLRQIEKQKQALFKEQALSSTLRVENSSLKSKLSAQKEQHQQEKERLQVENEALSRDKQDLLAENERAKGNFVKLTGEYNSLRQELEELQRTFSIKEGQFLLNNETLKDYEEFAFQISQHIEAAHVRHCCSGRLRSSKKLIREAQHCPSRFESALCKMGQLQIWMEATAQRLERVMEEQQLPSGTLGDISNIAHSFEQQLELVDLTERIEKERELDNNEQLVLDNLQKEVDRSEARERSKLVELDEVRQVLKVTKEINRELMEEINSKDYLLSECRKAYGQLIGNKPTPPALRQLQSLLRIH